MPKKNLTPFEQINEQIEKQQEILIGEGKAEQIRLINDAAPSQEGE